MRNKEQKGYIKVKLGVFEKMVSLLKKAENHLDFDFNSESSDEYLNEINKILEETNSIMLIDKIKKDLTKAMKAGNDIQKMALRMIMGEIPRLNLKAGQVPTDEQILSIIRKLVKSEVMTLEYTGQDESESEYINILKGYLPQMMSVEEIRIWIKENIDFSKYDISVKAMGEIMKQLKGKADGKVVREVLK